MKKKKPKGEQRRNQASLRVPLTFEQIVDGMLKTKPIKLPKKKKKAS